MAVEPGVGVGHREDQRILHDEVDPVDPLQHERVGEEEPHRGHHRRVEVHATAERAVVGAQELFEGGRGVEALQLERNQDRGELLLEERRWEDAGHEHVNELTMAIDQPEIRDRGRELGHLLDLLADRPDERPLGRGVVGELLCPEREQGHEAQLTLERKGVRVPIDGRLEVGRV